MMKNIFYFVAILALYGCAISNTTLNDNTKAKNARLVAVNQPANMLRNQIFRKWI